MDSYQRLMESLFALRESMDIHDCLIGMREQDRVGLKITMPNQSSRHRWITSLYKSDSFRTYINPNDMRPIDRTTFMGLFDFSLTDQETTQYEQTVWLNPAQVADGRLVKFCNDNHIPWRQVSRIPL